MRGSAGGAVGDLARLVMWVGALALAFVVLARLGKPAGITIPWARFGPWVATAPPEVVAAACLRLVAMALVAWLLGSTVAYAAIRLTRLPRGAGAVQRFTLSVVQRWVNGLAAAGIVAATTAGGCAQLPAVGQMIGVRTAAAAEASVAEAPREVSAWDTPAMGMFEPEAGVVYDFVARADGDVVALAESGPPGEEIEEDGGDWWPLRPGVEEDASEPAGGSESPAPGEPAAEPADTSESEGRADSSLGTDEREDAGGAGSHESADTGGSDGADGPSGSAENSHVGQAGDDRSVSAPAGSSGEFAPDGASGAAALDDHEYVVQPGDNLWSIAERTVAEAAEPPAAGLAPGEVAPYWLQVIEANQAGLRSGDPDLIFPGEVIHLPKPGL